jgi:arylsulfatase A-like enzyme
VWSAIAIRRVEAATRANLAAIAAVTIVASLVAVAALVASFATQLVAPVVTRAAKGAPRLARWARPWLGPALVGLAGFASMRALLPSETPSDLYVVWWAAVVARVAPVRAWLAARLEGRSGRAVVACAVVVGVLGYARLTNLPGRARLAIVRGPILDAIALDVARRAVDRDGDGYSPILGGGDCDDGDPRVYPGAHDVPGNGRDEDCSGSDATPFAPAALDAPVPPIRARANVILVHLDAVRPDHLGFAGYARATSPNLDRFRATATWFTRAYAPGPSTRTSMTAILTGQDPSRAAPAHDDGTRRALRPEVTTIAERLAARGYDRVMITIPYVVEMVRGIEKGFRVWESTPPEDDDARPRGRAAAATSDAAIARLGSLSDDPSSPFFLYAHYFCAHEPYASDGRHDFGRSIVDQYDAALATCDEEVGRFLAALDARADRERTVVVVLSDHGELLGEHGLVGHGTELYEPAVRALLLARLPGVDRASVDAPVTLGDLAPTILALAGVPRPEETEGWNLLALLGAPDSATRDRPLFLSEDGRAMGILYRSRAVVEGHMKYERDVLSGIEQLYDLDRDPGERVNLRRTDRADRDRLAALLESWSAYVTSDARVR